jgi:hypothetical protein
MPSDDIASLVANFASDLASIVRRVALHAVHDALGSGMDSAPPSTAARARRSEAMLKRAKRNPGEIDVLTKRLAEYIRVNPGQRMEQIKNGLGVATKQLQLPIRRLLEAKRIVAKGRKRSTTYSSVSGLVKIVKKPNGARAKATKATIDSKPVE